MRRHSRRKALIAFGAILTATIVLVAATMGLGKPSLPSGAVAFVEGVDDGEITEEQFTNALDQAAAGQEGQAPAAPGTPQFEALKIPAISDLLLAKWVKGEAAELGIEATDREVEAELQTIIDEQFGGQEQFDKFLEDSGLTLEEAQDRVTLQLLTQRLQERVVPTDPEVTDQEITDFYEENIEQFETPESRDVRTLLNPDEAKAQQALAQLEKDDSAASWKAVTSKLSTDEATADAGGLRQGVVPGQNEPALDEAIFNSAEGELVGPIEGDAGFYVVQVTAINEASTQPLDDPTKQQIQQTLVTQEQQDAVTEFQASFVAKWSARSVCSSELLVDDPDGSLQAALSQRCSNIEPPDEDGCMGDDEGEEFPVDPSTGEPAVGCGPFVPSLPVVSPLDTGGQPRPQGPVGPPQPQIPSDAQQLGGAPPGTVPPGTPPPGTVPPGTPPPGTVPAQPGAPAPPGG